MAKICKSCGKEYSGEYCEHCGYGNPNSESKTLSRYKKSTTPVRFMTEEQKTEYYDELNKAKESRRKSNGRLKHNPKQLRILIIVIIVVAVLIFGTLFGTGTIGFSEECTEVVAQYYEAIINEDFDSYASCFPSEMKDDYENDLVQTGYSEEEYMVAFKEDFVTEYGSDFTLEYEILSYETITEYSLDGYEEAYGTTPNITEAALVVTDVTFSGENGSETFRMNCYVGKIGRHWKMFNMQYEAGIITTDMEVTNSIAGTDDSDSSESESLAESDDTSAE
ncbi:MAG: hypothetical protein LUE12_07390 [Ruminococcus sp.]|nr:hypothetical protein [Ruminococcus sp.]